MVNMHEQRTELLSAIVDIFQKLPPGDLRTRLLMLADRASTESYVLKPRYIPSTPIPEEQWIDMVEHVLGYTLPFMETNLGPLTVKLCAHLIQDIHAVNVSGGTSYDIKRMMYSAYSSYIILHEGGDMKSKLYYHVHKVN